VDVLRVGGVQPQRHPLARLRDRVQVGARDDVADGERDRLGVEHDGVRRSCGGALQPQVLLELDTSLGYMLKAAASALHSAMEAVLRPLGMTITHYSCLELLAQRPGLSNSELARGAFVTRQSMNVLLQALERQGLVVRPAQAPVGRALPTELTARGRHQLKVASAAVRRVEQDMLANLNASEQDQMRRLLTACIASLTDPRVVLPDHT